MTPHAHLKKFSHPGGPFRPPLYEVHWWCACVLLHLPALGTIALPAKLLNIILRTESKPIECLLRGSIEQTLCMDIVSQASGKYLS